MEKPDKADKAKKKELKKLMKEEAKATKQKEKEKKQKEKEARKSLRKSTKAPTLRFRKMSSANEKSRKIIEKKLAARPEERELIEKGVIKTTRNIPVFGAPLAHVMYTSYTQFDLPLPFLDAAQFLRQGKVEDRLKTEGIFRVSGALEEINKYKSIYDTGGDPDFADANVHSVTGILKLYFRELPEPLLTYRAYETFINSQKEPNEIEGMKLLIEAINSLPPVNRALLGALMRLLREITKYTDVNKMPAENLGIVWGPTLLREEVENIFNVANTAQVVVAMIEHCDGLFGHDEKLEYHKPREAVILQSLPIPIPPSTPRQSGAESFGDGSGYLYPGSAGLSNSGWSKARSPSLQKSGDDLLAPDDTAIQSPPVPEPARLRSFSQNGQGVGYSRTMSTPPMPVSPFQLARAVTVDPAMMRDRMYLSASEVPPSPKHHSMYASNG